MKTPPLEAILQTAVHAARAAGDHALANKNRRRQVAQRHAHDVKLQLDLECQQKATEAILSRYPEHGVLGEEASVDREAGEALWVVDPLDGTVNFMHGLAYWCTAVAFRLAGEVVAGAVYLPEREEWYTATAAQEARLNGEPIRVSETSRLDHSLILTGLSKQVESEAAYRRFRNLALAAEKLRVMGAAAADICQVARGAADGYYEANIYVWDWSAAGLVARQAGARVDVLERFADGTARYVCTNGRIHEELNAIILS